MVYSSVQSLIDASYGGSTDNAVLFAQAYITQAAPGTRKALFIAWQAAFWHIENHTPEFRNMVIPK
jgi:hypothetical protein